MSSLGLTLRTPATADKLQVLLAAIKLCVSCLAGNTMAYRKVCDSQTGPLVGEVLHCSGGLDLDWDLDKEELQDPGPSLDGMQMQHVECQISGRTRGARGAAPHLATRWRRFRSPGVRGHFDFALVSVGRVGESFIHELFGWRRFGRLSSAHNTLLFVTFWAFKLRPQQPVCNSFGKWWHVYSFSALAELRAL